jgi:hypothetical protein
MAGCDDNEDEQGATIPTTPAPTVAQPTATAPAPAPTQTAPSQPQTPTVAEQPKPDQPSSGAPTCATGEAIRDLKFTGIGCEAAAAVTGEWERQINRCNTIDDPESPEGYTRRCEVRGYECVAKRDVRSDARSVSCRGGSSQVRFTWAP